MVTENPVSSSGCAVTTNTRGPCAKKDSEKRHAIKRLAIVDCFMANNLNAKVTKRNLIFYTGGF
jgi:hypothetical protein